MTLIKNNNNQAINNFIWDLKKNSIDKVRIYSSEYGTFWAYGG